jgi:hypothetical protein
LLPPRFEVDRHAIAVHRHGGAALLVRADASWEGINPAKYLSCSSAADAIHLQQNFWNNIDACTPQNADQSQTSPKSFRPVFVFCPGIHCR